MAYIVESAGGMLLRGTTWVMSLDFADRYRTEKEAHAALQRAKRFLRPTAIKNARVREIAD
jgi:ribosome-binding factor A